MVSPLWILANVMAVMMAYTIWTQNNHWWLIVVGVYTIGINYGYYKTRHYHRDRRREMERENG